MYKLEQVSAHSGKSHCLTGVLFKELFFVYFKGTQVLSKKEHLLMHKRTICGRRAGFPFFI